MTKYNFTNMTSGTDFTGILRFGNDVTNGWFGPMLLIGVFAVIFLSMISIKIDPSKAYASAIYITLLFSIVLRVIGVLTDMWMIIIIVCVAISTVILLISNN